MKWQGLDEFVHVAEAMSFTQAAKKMQVSTAQVSRQVTLLEERLNVKLLYRTTRKVSLTEEGNIYYQHCRNILNHLEEAELLITNRQSDPKGKIKLTAPVTYGEHKVLPLINDFVCLYPEIEISAYVTNQQVNLVEEGYDLAIRLGSLSDSSLIAKKLSSRSLYVCASPAYIAKHGKPNVIADLTAHNCLVGTVDNWHFNDHGVLKHYRVSGRLHYNSGFALADAALKSQGIVQLPDYYVQQHLDDGTLIELLEEYRLDDEGIWALYPYNRQLSPRIRLLVDYLAEHLNDN
ncbi:LysR family transcriptional regulator [Shewanella sp. A3A]|uniref:LysR family transcriptional regulator n=1 Tax=Shewanella electrica TaxID=515560 RepID=A0ABT2FGA3_9GAMM|nr:LysR family transcriptional regulator [Shewanella electrica]MCH1918973.1 LysR family transcriptional regulator [Shewanella ferrihydritica]MCH1923240.1 LysR family transcriptional regulator [Shewanella electrica]MCS4555337.1 LysR family transcriptional regulator [Shewanella electrica]